jgi:hypothetical protein
MGAPPLQFMQLFVVAPLLTQVRFGDWDAILADAAASQRMTALPGRDPPLRPRHGARAQAQAGSTRRRAMRRRCMRSQSTRRRRGSPSA